MPKFFKKDLLSEGSPAEDSVPVIPPHEGLSETHHSYDNFADVGRSEYSPDFLAEHKGESVPLLDPHKELESPLDTPELPEGHPDAAVSTKEDLWQHPAPEHHDDPVKTLLAWKAVSRPFRKKDRSFYTAVAVLIILISLIAILANEYMLVGVLFALGFLVYVLNFIPPEEIDYKLSTQGITIGNHFYHWQQLDSFWFSEKDGYKILNVLTQIRFPGLLLVVLGEKNEEEVRRVVARYLPFHEIAPKTMMEKWSESLQKHFPLENPQR